MRTQIKTSAKQSFAPAAKFPALPAILMGLSILLVALARIRLLDVFLERDEGEYAYMAQLILQGIPIYGDAAANMKFPGTSAVYALLFAVFGQSTVVIHAGLFLANAVSAGLVYLLGRRFLTPIAALSGATAFTVLASSWSVMGLWAHATHFVIAAALAGFVCIFRWMEARRLGMLLASGVFFGLAILMKQHGIFFAVLVPGYLFSLLRQQAVKPVLLFLISMLAPFALTCALLARAGVLENFWFWTISYAGAYASAVPLSQGIALLFSSLRHVTAVYWATWLLAGAGLVLLFRQWRSSVFLIGLFAVSFLAVCPGFYFREHYFILLLPAVSLCVAAVAQQPHAAFPWAVSVVLLFSVLEQSTFLFESTPREINAQVYGSNPFPEAVGVANFIRQNSDPGATIAILGSEPEIFFHSARRSATPYIYIYPLMEAHPFARKMQEEFIRNVEAKKPEFVVLVNVETSWLRRPDSHTRLFDWWSEYGQRHYTQAGVADILPNRSVYEWNSTYTPKSSAYLLVLKRKALAGGG